VKGFVGTELMFQSTHPCGVRLIVLYAENYCENQFQSTHPCGVRHFIDVVTWRKQAVSIHAPLRGATRLSPDIHHDGQCFNPRTPAGCDEDPYGDWNCLRCFNPRTPAGCDSGRANDDLEDQRVSIHAPLRGATATALGLSWSTVRFQSTHPCGVRPHLLIHYYTSFEVSIHAPLRGATLLYCVGPVISVSFNPRTPAGCD